MNSTTGNVPRSLIARLRSNARALRVLPLAFALMFAAMAAVSPVGPGAPPSVSAAGYCEINVGLFNSSGSAMASASDYCFDPTWHKLTLTLKKNGVTVVEATNYGSAQSFNIYRSVTCTHGATYQAIATHYVGSDGQNGAYKTTGGPRVLC